MQLIQPSPSDIIHWEKYPFHNTVISFPSFCNIKKQPKKPRLNFFSYFVVTKATGRLIKTTRNDVSSYVENSLPNMSDLPTIDHRVKRRIEKYERHCVTQQVWPYGRFNIDHWSNMDTEKWHVTNQKQDIYVECSNCRFSVPCPICQFSILFSLDDLLYLNLISVSSYGCIYLAVKQACSYDEQKFKNCINDDTNFFCYQ